MEKELSRTKKIGTTVLLILIVIMGIVKITQHLTDSDYDGFEKKPDPNEVLTEEYSDGDEYTGHFNRDGEFEGQGKYTFGDGGYYEGEWKEGNIIKGTHVSQSGNRYDGTFDENEDYHGQGKYTWSDGGSFEGEFKANSFYHGTRTYDTGSVYVGYFNEDEVRHGQGKMVYSDGTMFEGEWKDGDKWNGTYIDEEGTSLQVADGEWM